MFGQFGVGRVRREIDLLDLTWDATLLRPFGEFVGLLLALCGLFWKCHVHGEFDWRDLHRSSALLGKTIGLRV